MKRIATFEIINHGIEHEQYFQGCGVSFTQFDDVFTGIGNSEHEALDDALDQAAEEYDVSSVVNEADKTLTINDEHHEEIHHYISILIKKRCSE